jgi:glycosyltransferase involved in cell wall biosynthesis
MAFFSVIIPLYNKEKYIKNTLESVLKQTFTDFEIIIINDSSTDAGLSIIQQFIDPRIQIYHQKNQGVSVARNFGIDKSNSSLIAFLDADDYWFPNHLEELANLYLRFPNCGIYCSRYKIKTSENHFQIPFFNGITSSFEGIIENYFLSNMPFRITWTSCLLIPKDILNKFGKFTPGVTNGQDLELWTKIGIEYPVAINNKITAIYNLYIPNSLAKNNISSMKLMNFNQFKKLEEQNPDLKKFIDLYRIEYGLRYYIFGHKEKANKYLKEVDNQNLNFTIKLLLNTPRFILRFLFKLKNILKRGNINFNIYN